VSPSAPGRPAPCARCGREAGTARRWPDGPVCWNCYATAMETRAACAGCGEHRLAPGRDGGGRPLCIACAGMKAGFTCARCGREAPRYERGTCGQCVLSRRLAALLDDGTGRIRPELVPFHDHVRQMSRPRTGLLWISKPHVPPILIALARGQARLTHEGLSTLSPRKSATHIRDLLVACGVLPPADRFLLLFEQWLANWLAGITSEPHHRLLQQFATWHTLRKLRGTASSGPLGYGPGQAARCTLTQAAAFLAWLAGRDRIIGQCTQADIDAYFSHPGQSRSAAIPFLRWCAAQQEMPRLRVTARPHGTARPITQNDRLALIRRLAEDDALGLRDRVVALLILLYAQPVTKIIRLTTSDITHHDGTLLIRLGDPPAPVPQPFATLIARYLDARPNLVTATNPGSQLLFPGRRAGQPMHPTSLRRRLTAAGIPNITGRTAALRGLLLEAPGPVVASMLGYSSKRAAHIATAAGATWKNYAPGNHER
jgi:integrase